MTTFSARYVVYKSHMILITCLVFDHPISHRYFCTNYKLILTCYHSDLTSMFLKQIPLIINQVYTYPQAVHAINPEISLTIPASRIKELQREKLFI